MDARRDFEEAERRMPQSADAHLAMARIFVYSMPDLAKARGEFAAAEKLGAKFGPREIEEQADAWRIRAQQLASSNPREAWNAAQQARALYRRVAGFDRADEHLNELARIHQPGAKKRTRKRIARAGAVDGSNAKLGRGAAPAMISVREPSPAPRGQWIWLIARIAVRRGRLGVGLCGEIACRWKARSAWSI